VSDSYYELIDGAEALGEKFASYRPGAQHVVGGDTTRGTGFGAAGSRPRAL
jgi:hypothetical protein